jgi:hypothetical protein
MEALSSSIPVNEGKMEVPDTDTDEPDPLQVDLLAFAEFSTDPSWSSFKRNMAASQTKFKESYRYACLFF